MRKPIALVGYRSGLDLLVDIADELDVEIAGIFDKYFFGNTEQIDGIPFIGNEEQIPESDVAKYDFLLASGWAGHSNIKNIEHNGDNLRKRRIRIFRERNLPMANLISPSAFISPKTFVGNSVVVARDCYIRAKSHIGDFCYLDSGSAVAHDVRLGENVIMTPYTFVAGHIHVGDNVMIGAGSMIVNSYPDRALEIGNDVKIMAGTTVMRDVPDGKFVHSSGKILRRLDLKKE
jgi:serine acetyltransferase